MIDSPDVTLALPMGLIGVPDETSFRLRSDAASGLVELFSTRADGLDFYASPLDRIRPDLRALLVSQGHAGAGDVVLVLLAVHGEPPALTANLAGPIVIDPHAWVGRQLVLDGDEFPLRSPLSTAG